MPSTLSKMEESAGNAMSSVRETLDDKVTLRAVRDKFPSLLPVDYMNRDYAFVILTGCASALLMHWLSIEVGRARKRYKVPYPIAYSDTSEVFNCYQRAHQNTLEQYPSFLFTLGVGGLCYPRFVSAAGAGWIFGRILYAKGYHSGEPKNRIPGFVVSIVSSTLILGAAVATGHCMLRLYNLEQYPSFLFTLGVGGLCYPRFVSAAGAGWIFGRILYAKGYHSGEPKNRIPGFVVSIVSSTLILGAAVATGHCMLRLYNCPLVVNERTMGIFVEGVSVDFKFSNWDLSSLDLSFIDLSVLSVNLYVREYGGVILIGAASAIVLSWQSLAVSVMRKKRNVPYPTMYTDDVLFNCYQRAHQNTLETYPQFLAFLLLSGIHAPKMSIAAGTSWLIGRIVYACGYHTGVKTGRSTKVVTVAQSEGRANSRYTRFIKRSHHDKYDLKRRMRGNVIVLNDEIIGVMAGEDREILRAVWDGRLPLCLRLAAEDVCTAQEPDCFYLLVPRVSYFPVVLDKVRNYFGRFVRKGLEDGCDLWLDFDGIALKWHYPIGVLFDLLSVDCTLPWNLTVHYSNFPDSELIRLRKKEDVEMAFLNTVKEADALKHRRPVISTLQESEHRQLWLGLLNDRYDQFWSVNRKLMERQGQGDPFKHAPVRFHFPNFPFVQRLIRPRKDDGQLSTLHDALAEIFPAIKNGETHRVVLHGIAPPLETPLQWLSEHLSYPDNFLHVCLIPL
ncbi:unnamed protein product [Notodromas monacha]|uniref:Autophagy protein 5 n=1 Tax=Notodromas monacha TaxID=399045 RepID=A0A7R9GEU0_9CRUS|nr:unnamed protein product [Notodromas monacha]CAG0918411.1 unnamed protein product [Notodromas monacha]